ncbi:hypothetical protein MUN84_15800 [Hymenobacter sp. 5516J-16]|uniref:hypothetical protein n=1 Tax=Hymenobacter sp. 5516J-16 TaxID=2932253 RepID=UPI001FD1D3D8|nr:hypothetical protein [Hymenobacter sp. 5516J-16]UOQ76061.1 hypothetical protein MUN84_15800 [Hymenobacter sp. 5516J-16]
MAQGKTDKVIQAELIDQGLDSESATIVTQNLRDQFQHLHREVAKKSMLHGGLWLLGGCAVTGITFALASAGGGGYIMTWGAIIFGGFQLLKGIYQYYRLS